MSADDEMYGPVVGQLMDKLAEALELACFLSDHAEKSYEQDPDASWAGVGHVADRIHDLCSEAREGVEQLGMAVREPESRTR
jgi:hypothetical protein